MVLEDLNRCACLHITKYLAKYSKQQFEFVDFNIDAKIEATDPKLWEAICLLTRSTSEKKGLSRVSDPSSPAHHREKKIRRLFLLTSLLFCISDDYTIPLHTYITDLTEGQRGSAALVRILNQFGVCASSDTLARYIQAKASNPHKCIAQSLDMDSFTAVSADNIDFLHSYARHFKSSKNSSFMVQRYESFNHYYHFPSTLSQLNNQRSLMLTLANQMIYSVPFFNFSSTYDYDTTSCLTPV